MPEQALYLKWRPLSFDDVVGQDHITRTLRNSLKSDRIRHAYLFSGVRGTGKTTSARLLAKAVNCTHEDVGNRPCNKCHNCIAINEGRFLDLIEIDAATHTGVDDVRDLRDKIAFAPSEGRYKVYIIDEVHRFSGSAFDALLKTIEEPPDHALFVLATTEIDKVPATIKSRCLQFEFRRLSLTEMIDRLAFIAQEEGLQIEPAALELIARQGTGSARDSISLLDQIVADPNEVITLELTQKVLGTASMQAVKELADALFHEDVARGLHVINHAIDSGSDPRHFGQQFIEHLRAVLLTQTASADLVEASQEDQALFAEQAQMISRSKLLKAVQIFNDSVGKQNSGWQPQLSLELAFIEATQTPEQLYMPPPAMNMPAQSASSTTEVESAPENRPEPSHPGEPPIIPASVIQEKWLTLQQIADNTVSALLDHAQVWKVDGNRLFLAVQNDVFANKISERAHIIEQIIKRIHNVAMRVEVILVSADSKKPVSATPDEFRDDAVISKGLELGGKIHTDD